MADALGLSSGAVDGQSVDGVRPLGYTPGPWELDSFPVADGSRRVRGGGKIRAIVPSRDSDIVRRSLPEGHCNALLIAAAPDLLEAVLLWLKADQIHSDCEDCMGSCLSAEACGECFQSADDARIALRNAAQTAGVQVFPLQSANAVNQQYVETPEGSANT